VAEVPELSQPASPRPFSACSNFEEKNTQKNNTLRKLQIDKLSYENISARSWTTDLDCLIGLPLVFVTLCASEAAAQCIVISPVCGCVCLFVGILP